MTRLLLTCACLLAGAPVAHATSPVGEVNVDCARVEGWAQDPDDPAAQIPVHLYFDGPAGDPAATGIPISANLTLQAGCVGEQCMHGFRSSLPLSRYDGGAHPVHAYGIDAVDPPLELSLSPAVYTCAPLPITMGVKRHITGPAVLDQWQFSIFWDLMKVPDVSLAAVPKGVPVGEPPVLRVAEGTTEPMWLIDQGFRRPITPDVAAAWRLAAAAATPMPVAELMALPEGTPLSPRPILVQGSGAEVYVLDDHQCAVDDPDPTCVQPVEPTTGSADETGGTGSTGEDTQTGGSGVTTPASGSSGDDPTGGSGGPNTAGTDSSSDGPAEAGEGGCGCRSSAPAGGWALLLLPFTALRRRRAASAKSTV